MNFKRFSQVGLVVRNADEAFARFERNFGADKSQLGISDTSDPNLRYKDPTIHGEPMSYDAKFLFFPLGGIEVELIEPLDDKSIYAEFLAEHGEGLHHLLVEVKRLEEFENSMAELGAPQICGGHIENTAYEYFDARDTLGTIFEVCWKKSFQTDT